MTRPREVIGDLQEALLGFGEVLGAGLKPTGATPLNPEIGPHRRFDWLRTDLAAVKEVRSRLGGTINDVVLASAAGAIGRFLRQRGETGTDRVFRAQIPMSIRTRAERGTTGNRVVMHDPSTVPVTASGFLNKLNSGSLNVPNPLVTS